MLEGRAGSPASANRATEHGHRLSKKKFKEIEPPLREKRVKKEAILPITRQCDLLSISRGLFYYRPAGLTDLDLKLMKKMDELFTENPTRGTRRLSKALKKHFGLLAGRDKVRVRWTLWGSLPFIPRRSLSIANKSHLKYPYLLRDLAITRPNQVWSTDITYLRLKKGFVYLTAVIELRQAQLGQSVSPFLEDFNDA